MTPQAVGFGNTAGDGPSDRLALWHFGLGRSATLFIGGGSRAVRRIRRELWAGMDVGFHGEIES